MHNGISGKCFQNWANTYSCWPSLYFEPETIEEIKEILKSANENKKVVKVVGVGHSPSSIACTDDYMISLNKFNRIIDIDSKSLLAKVQGGIRLDKLNDILYDNNMALSVLGSISDQTIAGAVCVGYHGTGISYGILSNYVREIEMILASGKIKTYSKTQNSEEFGAVLCSLGCLGVILTVTIECEPAFKLEQIEFPAKLEDVLHSLDSYKKSSDHFRMLWYPHTDHVLCYSASRTNKTVNPRKFNWIKDRIIGYYILEFLFYIATFFNFLIPYINLIYFKIFSSRKEYVDRSYNVFNFDCLFKQYAFESAIPIKETAFYLLELKSWLENNPSVKVHFGVEIRFSKSDDIWISPCYNQDSCWLNILMFRPYGKEYAREEWWKINQKLMNDCKGRPHWAKTHSLKKSDLVELYPKFEDFDNLRKKLDPNEIFINDCLRHLFS
ncbi:unnamed protein product [Brachionus calyciflorus]|uniref:L-gulonolactone oxidase n=1 Tax=Brachionus calyciflorus TaxID=104777 RepID=A0A813N0B8_9BILA|nr:unnamed protein product [Brachionus calyciflorus]